MRLGYSRGIGNSLLGLAEVAAQRAEHERTARILAAAAALGSDGSKLERFERDLRARTMASLEAALGREGLEAILATGGERTIEEALADVSSARGNSTTNVTPAPAPERM